MNLFYLDKNLDACAEAHVDKHIVKMPLEVAQILCTAIWVDVHLGLYPGLLKKSPITLILLKKILSTYRLKVGHLHHICL